MIKKALIITAILIGILLALQARSFKKVESLIQRSGPASLLSELRTFQIANQQLREHVSAEEKKLNDLRTKISGQTIEDEIKKMRLLAGEVKVEGEGIEITIDKPIQAFWVSDIIAQLVSAGAEAVSVNGIRLVTSTSGLRDIGGGLVMNRNFLRPPFNIMVIGPTTELKTAIAQEGGIMDRIKDAYLTIRITVAEKEKITLEPLSE